MSIEEISVVDLHALGPGITLIDVREDDEWLDARVPFARQVALGTMPENLDAFNGEPTYVMCKVGGRSFHACEFAASQGLKAVNVSGGMLAWLAAGYETESGPSTHD
ncbi:MAG: rhodanese-related sulfurtransferase [Ilumatobacter sp.]